jgi:hypothetical protein
VIGICYANQQLSGHHQANRDSMFYNGGARAQYPFPFGARAHIEIAKESLKLFL